MAGSPSARAKRAAARDVIRVASPAPSASRRRAPKSKARVPSPRKSASPSKQVDANLAAAVKLVKMMQSAPRLSNQKLLTYAPSKAPKAAKAKLMSPRSLLASKVGPRVDFPSILSADVFDEEVAPHRLTYAPSPRHSEYPEQEETEIKIQGSPEQIKQIAAIVSGNGGKESSSEDSEDSDISELFGGENKKVVTQYIAGIVLGLILFVLIWALYGENWSFNTTQVDANGKMTTVFNTAKLMLALALLIGGFFVGFFIAGN